MNTFVLGFVCGIVIAFWIVGILLKKAVIG